MKTLESLKGKAVKNQAAVIGGKDWWDVLKDRFKKNHPQPKHDSQDCVYSTIIHCD